MKIKPISNNQTTHKIKICKRCNGLGVIKYQTEDPAYSGPYNVPCNECKGTGRIVVVRKTVYAPFSSLDLISFTFLVK